MSFVRFICFVVALILFFLAGCGIASWSMGSVTLSTLAFGLFFLTLFFAPDWPRRAA